MSTALECARLYMNKFRFKAQHSVESNVGRIRDEACLTSKTDDYLSHIEKLFRYVDRICFQIPVLGEFANATSNASYFYL